MKNDKNINIMVLVVIGILIGLVAYIKLAKSPELNEFELVAGKEAPESVFVFEQTTLDNKKAKAFVFNYKDQELMSIAKDGTFFAKGEKIEGAEAVYKAFEHWVKHADSEIHPTHGPYYSAANMTEGVDWNVHSDAVMGEIEIISVSRGDYIEVHQIGDVNQIAITRDECLNLIITDSTGMVISEVALNVDKCDDVSLSGDSL